MSDRTGPKSASKCPGSNSFFALTLSPRAVANEMLDSLGVAEMEEAINNANMEVQVTLEELDEEEQQQLAN